MTKFLGIHNFHPRDFNNLLVGTFVSMAIIFLGIVSFFILKQNEVFADEYTIYSDFKKGLGLKEGIKVQFNGVDVGRVDDVQLTDRGSALLTLKIKKVKYLHSSGEKYKAYNKHILSTSTIYPTREHNIMSDRVLLITKGSDDGKILTDQDTINSTSAQDIEAVLENVLKLITKFEKIANVADSLINMAINPNTSVGSLLASDQLYTTLNARVDELGVILRSSNQFLNQSQRMVTEVEKQLPSILDNGNQLAGNAIPLFKNLTDITSVGTQLITRIDTTMYYIQNMVSDSKIIVENLSNLMIDAETKMQRIDDFIYGASNFWLIKGNLPTKDTIPVILNYEW